VNVIREITPPHEPTKMWLGNGIVYAGGLVASSTAFGLLAGALGQSIHIAPLAGTRNSTWLVGLIGAIAFAYGLRELAVISLPMPQVRWQVPVLWSRYGKTIQSALYGLVLGVDVFTLVPYATFYILLLLEVTLGSTGGALLGLVYGVVRAFVTLMLEAYLVVKRQNPNTLATRILHSSQLFHKADGIALLAVGELLVVAVLVVR
jgi:hypothetical protein